jgi:hypothetical protein
MIMRVHDRCFHISPNLRILITRDEAGEAIIAVIFGSAAARIVPSQINPFALDYIPPFSEAYMKIISLHRRSI